MMMGKDVDLFCSVLFKHGFICLVFLVNGQAGVLSLYDVDAFGKTRDEMVFVAWDVFISVLYSGYDRK